MRFSPNGPYPLAISPTLWFAAIAALATLYAPLSPARAQNDPLPLPMPQPPQPPQLTPPAETKPAPTAPPETKPAPTPPAETEAAPTDAPAQFRLAPSRYRLGVVTTPVNLNSIAPRLRPPGRPTADKGQQIVQVQFRSAAQRVGLEVGDIIIAANGRKTQTLDDLTQAIASSGGVLQMTIRNVRDGQDQQVRVPLDVAGPNPGPDPGPGPNPGPFPPQAGVPIIAIGILQTGIVAPGAETTGYAIRTSSGVRYEIDLGGRPDFTRLARRLDGRPVLVSGALEWRSGVETPRRRAVIVVDSLAADSLRPRPYEPTPAPSLPRALDAPPNAPDSGSPEVR